MYSTYNVSVRNKLKRILFILHSLYGRPYTDRFSRIASDFYKNIYNINILQKSETVDGYIFLNRSYLYLAQSVISRRRMLHLAIEIRVSSLFSCWGISAIVTSKVTLKVLNTAIHFNNRPLLSYILLFNANYDMKRKKYRQCILKINCD